MVYLSDINPVLTSCTGLWGLILIRSRVNLAVRSRVNLAVRSSVNLAVGSRVNLAVRS